VNIATVPETSSINDMLPIIKKSLGYTLSGLQTGRMGVIKTIAGYHFPFPGGKGIKHAGLDIGIAFDRKLAQNQGLICGFHGLTFLEDQGGR
jgi:hypothetical protein